MRDEGADGGGPRRGRGDGGDPRRDPWDSAGSGRPGGPGAPPPGGGLTTTGAGALVAAAALGVAAGVLVARFVYPGLTGVPASAGLTLGLLAVVEAILAWDVRRRIRHAPGAGPVQPVTFARYLALAKASALVGAASVGLWVALLVAAVIQRELPRYRADVLPAGACLIAALMLTIAALLLERALRVPPPPDEPPDAPAG